MLGPKLMLKRRLPLRPAPTRWMVKPKPNRPPRARLPNPSGSAGRQPLHRYTFAFGPAALETTALHAAKRGPENQAPL